MSSLIVDVVDATVGYESRTVLRNVSLNVKPGEAVALLGPNGSGKSTLVRTCLGLVSKSAGAVRLFGTEVERFRQWHRIGYVPQRLTAGGSVPASVTEVVASGRLSRRRIPWPATSKDREVVSESLEAMGLADRANEAVTTLSGGQQQRVLIARALASQPDILVMDEPTSGVDAANQELFASLLATHTESGGAVLLVAHELGATTPIIDRAVVLSDGAVVHDGAVPLTGDTGGDHVHGNNSDGDMWSVA